MLNANVTPIQEVALAVAAEIMELTDDQGLTFLELLAHNLTIGVRMAASRRQPMGRLTEEQARLAMYWISETLHNVVQLTRELRLERERWSQNETWKWIELWQNYNHGAQEIEWAIQHSIEEMPDE
jgi:hypothetical protein